MEINLGRIAHASYATVREVAPLPRYRPKWHPAWAREATAQAAVLAPFAMFLMTHARRRIRAFALARWLILATLLFWVMFALQAVGWPGPGG